jgi:hypothetical protein
VDEKLKKVQAEKIMSTRELTAVEVRVVCMCVLALDVRVVLQEKLKDSKAKKKAMAKKIGQLRKLVKLQKQKMIKVRKCCDLPIVLLVIQTYATQYSAFHSRHPATNRRASSPKRKRRKTTRKPRTTARAVVRQKEIGDVVMVNVLMLDLVNLTGCVHCTIKLPFPFSNPFQHK